MTQNPLAARNSDSGCLRGIEGMPSQRTTTFWAFRSRDGGRNSATICSLNLVLNICPDIIPYSPNSQSHSIADNFFRVQPLSTVAVVASNLGLPSHHFPKSDILSKRWLSLLQQHPFSIGMRLLMPIMPISF